MEERTIKCPFDEFLDMEIPLGIIFDTYSIGVNTANNVAAITKWIVMNKNVQASKEVFNILKENLGADRLKLYIDMYLKTYDKKNMKAMRFHPIDDEKKVKDLFYIFNKINELIPTLSKVVLYYNRQQ